MKISHKIVNVSDKDYVYIYIIVEDIYEFGYENFRKDKNSNLLYIVRDYINNNIDNLKKAALVIVINGIVIGTTTYLALMPTKANNQKNILTPSVNVYNEQIQIKEKNKEENLENIVEKENKENKTSSSKNYSQDEKVEDNKKIEKDKKSTSNVVKKTNNNNNNKSSTSNLKKTTSNTKNNTQNSTKNNTKNNNTQSKIKIKFNNKGVISNIDLEEYVLGVVAAEMPASFSQEALKAQAVASRTYAMKKYQKGITLLNSTAHQVYNTKEDMKAKWGKDYDKYYNKVKSAIDATYGEVLKYNNEYIEASYYAISNGSSELPKYVWNTDYPYLKAVSSTWDENLSAANYSVDISYKNLSKKLKITVDENTKIEVISKTEGNRINKIKIGDKTFTGIKLRSILGLRSTDFEIIKEKNYVTIKQKGYGHGVGMSQYGANGAAYAGYTYKQILKHYYPGTTLTRI